MKREWTAIAPVKAGRGLMRGGLLRNPDNETVARFKDLAMANQCAAAMNLTTAKERVDYCAKKAGY